jgi:hypothetical protein
LGVCALISAQKNWTKQNLETLISKKIFKKSRQKGKKDSERARAAAATKIGAETKAAHITYSSISSVRW